MIDTITRRPIRVSTDGTAGPYLLVPFDQLKGVQRLLDAANITNWVESGAISLDDEPAVFVINLGLYGKPELVQSLLDSAE